MKRSIIGIAALAAISLSGCGFSDSSTNSGYAPLQSDATNYQVISGWTLIPADNDAATDIHVRIIKIAGICYVQSASQKDWQYAITPLNATC